MAYHSPARTRSGFGQASVKRTLCRTNDQAYILWFFNDKSMSKDKSGKKKKVVVTTDKKDKKKTVKPTASRRGARPQEPAPVALEIGKANYILLAGGLGMVFLGFILMAGGDMPAADVWEEDVIYSARRTVAAPGVILIGLVMAGWSIFKK